MADQLQVQVFDAFLGSEEGVHSILLPDIFSSSGSKNLYMDKMGRAKKVDGYSKQNNSQVVTQNAGDVPIVAGLFPYRKNVSGVITRQLIGVFIGGTGWQVMKSTDDGTTWTFIADLGDIDNYPDFAQFGNDLFITNGAQTPRTWNGTTLRVSGGTQSPTPTALVSANTGPLKGNYKYKIVSREDDGTRSPGSVTSTAISVEDGQAELSWGQDSNTEVVGYEIYRTTGTGVLFYFLTYVDGITNVTFTDDVPDASILESRPLDEHGDPPDTVMFAEPHKGRMWWMRTGTQPTTAWWSDPGDPDSVYGQHYLKFEDSDTQGDIITGGVGNFGEQFVVFTEKAVWAVSGTGTVLINSIIDWNKERKNVQTGSVSHRSVVRVPSGARYISQTGEINTTSTKALAYFTPLGDIRLFDGQSDIVISHPLKDTLSTFTYSARANVHAYHDASRSQFVWMVPLETSDTPNKAVVWNYRWGVWYVWEPFPFICSTESESEASAAFQLAGGQNGHVYKLFNGSDFDGRNIQARWMTKTIRGVVNVKDDLDPALSYMKRWRWADILFKIDGTAQLTVEWLRADASDFETALGSKVIGTSSVFVLSSDGDFLVSASGDFLVVQEPAGQAKVPLIESDGRYRHDLGIRLRIGDNAQSGSWAIEGMALAYQRLAGLKRRSQ